MYFKWTKELVKQEALKYSHRSEFSRKSPSAYKRAREDKYLDDVCSHMESIGNKVMRLVYSYEFSDNFVYIGLTYNIERRHSFHIQKGHIYEHIKKTKLNPIRKILSNGYIFSTDAAILEEKFINEYKSNGWNLLNKSKGGELGGGVPKWTKEKILSESLKYNSRYEFRKKSPKAYDAAIRNNLLDYVCKHMKKILKSWTKEMIQEVALKYSHRWDFQKFSPNEYSIAHKHKWLNEVCLHMNYK